MAEKKTTTRTKQKTTLHPREQSATNQAHHQAAESKSPRTHAEKNRSKSKSKPHPLRYKIYFTIFAIAWVSLCTVASQLVIAYPMRILVGPDIIQPGWTLLYYILSYAIAISLIIFIPPRLVRLYRDRHSMQSNSSRNSTKTLSSQDASVQSNHDSDKPLATQSTPTLSSVEEELSSTPHSLGVQHLPTFVDIGLAPIAYVVYLFLAGVLTKFMSQFAWFDADQSQDVGFGYYITGLDRIYALIAIIFIAPIAEEIVMRGWLYGKLRRKWNVPVAMLLVSLCFAILHGQWNVGVSVFILSLILCSLREITGTIWSGILLHILTNGIAFYIIYIAL